MSDVVAGAGTASARPRGRPTLVSVRDAEATRQRILDAALTEFADKGLAGARIDVIADAARSNKRMIYYYFDGKEQLYIAVLEHAYIDMRRQEAALALDAQKPVEAIRALVHFKFDYYAAHPWLVGLLNGENMLGAKFLRQSKRLPRAAGRARRDLELAAACRCPGRCVPARRRPAGALSVDRIAELFLLLQPGDAVDRLRPGPRYAGSAAPPPRAGRRSHPRLPSSMSVFTAGQT